MSDHYADKVMRDALMRATGDLDLDAASQAISDAVQALQKQAEVLKRAKYDHRKPEMVARAFSHTGKTLDELYRLVKFSKGQPDSRPEIGAAWIQLLTDEELAELTRRAEMSEAETEEKEKSDSSKPR